MWLFTRFGYFSIARNPAEDGLTVRAWVRQDLDALRERYLPALGPVVEGVGHYRYRANVSAEAFAAAAAAIARDIDYSDFEKEVESVAGSSRSGLYAGLWPRIRRLEREDDRIRRTAGSRARQRRGPDAADLAGFAAALAGLKVGEPRHFRNLTLFPLHSAGDGERPYDLLREALQKGEAEVREVSEGGSVPELLLVNRGGKPILVIEGEILEGAKQNRMVNVTVLVAAHAAWKMPVCCVEAGRWSYVSQHFRATRHAPPSIRGRKVESVLFCRQGGGGDRADQRQVWADVEASLERTGARSTTDSLVDGYAAAEPRLESYREGLKLPEGAVGFVVARGRKVVGMDLFDSPATLATLWPRLAEGYFMEAVADRGARAPAAPGVAEEFLAAVAKAARPRAHQAGPGVEIEIAEPGLAGQALCFEDRLCHLAAFRVGEAVA